MRYPFCQHNEKSRFLTRRLLVVLLILSFSVPVEGQENPAAATGSQSEFEDALTYANMLFDRNEYGVAAKQYQVFIREQPNSPNIQIAWFRLGECYLKVNQPSDARTTFNYLIENYRQGSFVGAAAYQLGQLSRNEKNYRNALAYYKIAKQQLATPKVKHQAQYYYARCLQLTKQPKEALAEFEELIASAPPAENPFFESATMESARLHFELGDTELAVEKFKTIADTATSEEYKEEAIVRGGLLAAEAGMVDVSEELLSRALKFSDTSPWKSLAQVGAIVNAFARGDYDRVIGIYNAGAYTPPNESRAKMLIVVAHSYRMKGDLDSAKRLYNLVEVKYPKQEEGIEAGYRRLQILHQLGDPSLPDAADNYARVQSAIDPSNPYIDMAWLMKAEYHFGQAENSASGPGSQFAIKHYSLAASAYGKVRINMIDEKYREISLYKHGWSQIESGDMQDGIVTLTSFIQQHRTSPLSSSAIAKRAMAYQQLENHQYALEDYKDLTKRFPDAPEVEFALQQIALIYAHQRKTPQMIIAYKELLERFPETDGAGEAHYWIGVGHFNMQQFQEAIPELNQAREIDPQYEDKATLRLVICHYQLEEIQQLAGNARRYLQNAPAESANPDSPGPKRPEIPAQVLDYLGKKLASVRNYEDAEYFLSAATSGKDPSGFAAATWKLLAECRSELKMHEGVIVACDNFLVQTKRPSERASAYLQRGLAQFCLQDYEAAKSSAQESLRSQKEGRTNAEARILLGDIAATNGNLADAARDYLVVSQIFSDREVTPKALSKAINAYLSLGNRDKATQLKQELTLKFPGYEIPEDLNPDC